jgi:hypothetical protein
LGSLSLLRQHGSHRQPSLRGRHTPFVASLRCRRSNSPHSSRSSRCRGSPATLTPNQARATGQVLGDDLRLAEARAAGAGEEQRSKEEQQSATGAPRRRAGRGAEQRSSIRKGRPRSGATELDSRPSPCSPAAPPPRAASRSSAHPSTEPRREIQPAVRRWEGEEQRRSAVRGRFPPSPAVWSSGPPTPSTTRDLPRPLGPWQRRRIREEEGRRED